MADREIAYEQFDTDYSRSGFREDIVEDAAIGIFEELGYLYARSSQIAPDGSAPERDAYSDTILTSRLTAAVERLNPAIPAEARASAIKQLFVTETPSLVEENRRIHRLLTEGADVEFVVAGGEIKGDKVWLIDFDDVDSNDWLVTNQFTVVEGRHKRRPDVVVFVNGLPLAVIELKNAGAETADIGGLQPVADLQGAGTVAVSDQCCTDRLRWRTCPDRIADRRRGTLHAVAHRHRHGWRFYAAWPARNGDAAARRV
jgi:type I restriction enzyme R subunit